MTTTRRAALAASFLVGGALAAPARAKPAAKPAVAPKGGYGVPFSEVVPFKSKVNGADYALYVRTPPTYADMPGRLPLVVSLDADYSFAIAANHLDHLAGRQDQGPEAVLVSIAYAGVYPDRTRYDEYRTRDYTPVFAANAPSGETTPNHSGGAAAFQRVMIEEVLPQVEKRWRTDAADRTLVGHSYGGLFAAFMLHTRPDIFSRYLMVSPSLWYANELTLKREDGLAKTRLPRKTRVWMGVGGMEEQAPPHFPMISNLQRFAAQLAARGDPNLIVQSRVFEDETHASIFPAAFSTGVRHLFRQM